MQAIMLSMSVEAAALELVEVVCEVAAGCGGATATSGAVYATVSAAGAVLASGASTGCAFLASSLNIAVTSFRRPSKRSISGPLRRPFPKPGPPRCFKIIPISVRIFCLDSSGLDGTTEETVDCGVDTDSV